MPTLNKPARELFIDLINDSSKRVNSGWEDISYDSISIGVPTPVQRTLDSEYRNTEVNVYDAVDTEMLSPYKLNYDRVSLQDLTRRYRNALIFPLPANTATVTPASLVTALNQAAGTALVASDLVNTPYNVGDLPATMTITAAAGSLIYCDGGEVTITAPLQHVQLPYIGEMSALGVKLLGSLTSIATLAPGMGYVQSYALPAFDRISEYVEYYGGPGPVKTQLRLYSRYALLSQPLVPEAESTVHLNVDSCRNFSADPDDYIGKVVQIDNELCLILDLTFGSGGPSEIVSFLVKRGLDDTLPVQHSIGSTLYVIRDDGPKGLIAVTDDNPVNAKCLAKIGGDTEEPNSVDYITTAFQNRLGRPYPVRNAKVNGRWDDQIVGVGRNYTVTWEHHPRFSGGVRIADMYGWYEHTMYPDADPGVEYQVTVKIADGGSEIYSSTRTTGTSHTFEMPAFDGEVILEIKSLIMSVVCLEVPSIRFEVVEGGGLAPSMGVVTLIPSSTGVSLDVEVDTPGSPVAVGFTAGGTDYPYAISWEVDEGAGFHNFASNTKFILFADYPDYAGMEIRAIALMSNSEGNSGKTSATFTLPD